MILDFPWWFVVLCLGLGAGYAWLLYWWRNKDSELPKGVRYLLTGLRFVVVSGIALLLLAPVVKNASREKEEPVILVLEDQSESVGKEADLDYDFGRNCQVERIPFGGESTDIAEALETAWNRYEGRNIGAIVLASDGIRNAGKDPLTLAPKITSPIYTVALGDTTHYPDAAIGYVRYNRIAYLGSRFPVEVTVNAFGLEGIRKRLDIFCDGQRLATEEIAYNSDYFTVTRPFLLEAEKSGAHPLKPGVHTYRIVLEADGQESNLQNNSYSFAVEVLDGHQKVAIVGAAPHPDMAALRQAVEANENFEAEVFLYSDIKGRAQENGSESNKKLKDYDLLILHNLPSERAHLELLAGKQPILFVLGSKVDLPMWNKQHLGVEIYTNLKKTNEILPVWNEGFGAFSMDEEAVKSYSQMPPLTAPFGDYKTTESCRTLFYARIGAVKTGQPMIALNTQEGRRYVFVMGEGLWRWRLQDFQQNGSHEYFNSLVSRLVVWATGQSGSDRFRINAEKIYRSGEPVVIEAELYDQNFELTSQPPAELTLDGKKYSFAQAGSRYRLNLGTLEPGTHSYTAQTTLSGETFTRTGGFVVEDINLEQISLVADHTMLHTLSNLTGGEMVAPSEMDRLKELINSREEIKPVVYTRYSYSELFHLPWVLVLLIVLCGTEWVLRKYNGEI